MVTALTPYIGYAAAAEVAKRALAEAGDIRQLVLATDAISSDRSDSPGSEPMTTQRSSEPRELGVGVVPTMVVSRGDWWRDRRFGRSPGR